ncbi:ABC transporter substrate-binding protein [Rugamonas sp. CCM 8940]|uniref:ABC transporter substrate-binding protein n=1 Tax=Rugamonas sp. CCM 8940 TaxID=2765359 RepID=UPI001F28639D|nr:ABC transporter substrate binding protein [Rugamonas sp. CCM 8940]
MSARLLSDLLGGLLLAALLATAAPARALPEANPDAAGAAVPARPGEAAPRARRNEPLQLAQAGDTARRQSGEPIAVLFPDIGEPYRKVFTEIIDGIEEQGKLRVRSYPVANNADLAELQAALKRNGSRVVIALGRQGVKAASGLEPALGVVVGGISSVPDADKLSGISLSPDPALLFGRLKSLLPAMRRVIVVYNPQNSEALIRQAREAARGLGLELNALEAADLASAARRYESAFAAADGRHDALWLPPDATTVDESTILPIVLRESWNRSVPIFSSSILHVKKGALFALYPNNFELGRELAGLAGALLLGEPPRKGVSPLRAVRIAFNWRTASHIGLNIDAGQQRTFDFLFPEP